jgi:hypothetical protein
MGARAATTPTDRGEGWAAVYCSATKTQAREDAKLWHARSFQKVRVVPGSGHRTRRFT